MLIEKEKKNTCNEDTPVFHTKQVDEVSPKTEYFQGMHSVETETHKRVSPLDPPLALYAGRGLASIAPLLHHGWVRDGNVSYPS